MFVALAEEGDVHIPHHVYKHLTGFVWLFPAAVTAINEHNAGPVWITEYSPVMDGHALFLIKLSAFHSFD